MPAVPVLACDHARAEHRYRPSRTLRHLVNARNTTCTAPGCGRRAARCDLDHTNPHHHGGLTCECNLAWHTPAGRTYTTTPTQYAA